MDLVARRGKFSHPSTFAIQFPKVNSNEKTLVQIPRVCILCSFGISQQQPYILHSELETLLHEFGHCLSSLLSRTEYQHVAGTRAALDFIETPSTFMEYFAWDHRFLSLFAKHDRSAQVLSESTLDSWRKTKHMFSAMDGLTTVCNSLFDLIIHGPFPYVLPNGKTVTSTTQVLREIENELAVIPHVDGTHWHSRFGHLIGYGAGYYSYVFCKIFSSNIWHKYFKSDPLNKSVGQLYQDNVLKFGGSKDPLQLLVDYLKFDPLDDSNYINDLKEDCNLD